MPIVRAALVAGVLAAAATGAPSPRWIVSDPGQGVVPLSSGTTGAEQLSGITWAEGSRYYAVDDRIGMLFPLRIALDPRSGTIVDAAIEPGVRLAGTTDSEGVACMPGCASVLVSDEDGPAIREYRVDGTLMRSIRLPPVFTKVRKNRSLESLSADPDHTALWTANEETLAGDGPRSTARAGSVVRLQRFDRADRPDGQWAYVTDSIPGTGSRRGHEVESSGVSDLVALPGGAVLVLERAFGAIGFRIRLYQVDFAGATDVSALPALKGARYVPVGKRLLWERIFPDYDFEGAALGPALADGTRSLILISDNGHGFRQGLYALTVKAAVEGRPSAQP